MAINEVEGEEYEHAVELAKQAGVKVASLSLFWDEMEEDPGDFDQGWLPLIDYYYPAMGLAISLELPVIDTGFLLSFFFLFVISNFAIEQIGKREQIEVF